MSKRTLSRLKTRHLTASAATVFHEPILNWWLQIYLSLLFFQRPKKAIKGHGLDLRWDKAKLFRCTRQHFCKVMLLRSKPITLISADKKVSYGLKISGEQRHWQYRLFDGLKLFGKKIFNIVIAAEVTMNSEIGIDVSFDKHFLSIHNTHPFPAWKTTSHSLAGIPKSYGWPYSELASACVKILPSHSVDEVERKPRQWKGCILL